MILEADGVTPTYYLFLWERHEGTELTGMTGRFFISGYQLWISNLLELYKARSCWPCPSASSAAVQPLSTHGYIHEGETRVHVSERGSMAQT